MKLSLLLGVALAAIPLLAQPADRYAGERPPVRVAGPRDSGEPSADHGQRLYAPAATLVSTEQAREILARFRSAYERLGRPRFVIAVNRELVDAAGGLQLASRKERVEGVRTEVGGDLAPVTPPGGAPQTQVNVHVGGGSSPEGVPTPVLTGPGTLRTEKVIAENDYESRTSLAPTLADRQTVRDLERLIGRPLRAGGVALADQRFVAQLIEDKPMDHFLAGTNESARKDREALIRVADAVVEVLVSSRALVTPGLSGDETYAVPDIQATVVRLKDGAILGQASSRDVLGKDRYAGALVRTYDVNEIAEATALALMEDLAATVP